MRKRLLTTSKWLFALSLCLATNQLYSQKPSSSNKPDKEIRGSVTDSAGGVEGVTVSVKNKSGIGTTTDVNGKFILSVPPDAVLVFSMVGYEINEVPVKGQEVLNIKLKRVSGSLDDVVVVARCSSDS